MSVAVLVGTWTLIFSILGKIAYDQHKKEEKKIKTTRS